MESEILGFIRKELEHRGKPVAVSPDTSLLISNLFDSLFVVDLIVFLEGKFPSQVDRFANATKADLDTVAKIIEYMNGNA